MHLQVLNIFLQENFSGLENCADVREILKKTNQTNQHNLPVYQQGSNWSMTEIKWKILYNVLYYYLLI